MMKTQTQTKNPHPILLLQDLDTYFSNRKAPASLQPRTAGENVIHATVFRLGELFYYAGNTNISQVYTYHKHAAPSSIPGSPPWIIGLTSIKSELITVVDLSQLLLGEATRIGVTTRILVVKSGEHNIGFLINELIGTRRFSPAQLSNKGPIYPDGIRPWLKAIVYDGKQYWAELALSKLAESEQLFDMVAS